ncbi:Pre-ATP-grasp domain-containing protein, partial [Pavlovales sp. CCMP2436]
RVFRRVLIANNGMAATKFIISVRRWLHLTCGDAGLIQFVGMATPDDIRANARHVSLADVIEEVPAGPNSFNYADVNLIISLA